MPGFLGMRGTGSFTVEGQRPKNWREMILMLYPNGDAPLTAILSRMKSEKVDDPEFNWFTKTLSQQRGAITGVYTDAGLSTAYTTGGTAGQTLYVKLAEEEAKEFRVGHQVIFRDDASVEVDVNGKVTDRMLAGANSYLSVMLLENDRTGGKDISDTDSILIVGNVNPEGGPMPDAISYDPVKMRNFTQIFRTPLEITRTAKRTRLRTGESYKEQKREALEYHSIEMEKAFLWGKASERVGANGQPERTTEGIINFIKTYAPSNCVDFRQWTAANHNNEGWTTNFAGEDFLDTVLEQIFRYGKRDKLALCGSGALLGINKMIKMRGEFSFTAKTADYGIKVIEWVTPFGVINMISHPLFSYEPSNRHSMVVLEPQNLNYRYIDDTTFYGEGEKQNTGHTRIDGLKEEFLTEAGLEFHHPVGCGFLNGIGLNP